MQILYTFNMNKQNVNAIEFSGFCIIIYKATVIYSIPLQ